MVKKEDRNSIVALDIGTSKIVALVGEFSNDDDSVEIIGIGSCQSRGLVKGVVNDIESTTQSRKAYLYIASETSFGKKHSVYFINLTHVRTTGAHLQ